jgi:FkbM family methyltransferase
MQALLKQDAASLGRWLASQISHPDTKLESDTSTAASLGLIEQPLVECQPGLGSPAFHFSESHDAMAPEVEAVRQKLSGLKEMRAMRRVLEDMKDAVIVEAGAYDGKYTSIIVEALPSPPAAYFAFEPDPRNIERFRTRDLPAFVELVGAAIGAEDGFADMWLSSRPGREGASSSLRKPTGHLSHYPSTRFPCKARFQVRSLDSFATEKGIDRVDFLFTDIQGSERDLFAGGRSTLSGTKYWFTVAHTTAIYDGMWTRSEILNNLPGWKVVAEFRDDVLLMNTAL